MSIERKDHQILCFHDILKSRKCFLFKMGYHAKFTSCQMSMEITDKEYISDCPIILVT